MKMVAWKNWLKHMHYTSYALQIPGYVPYPTYLQCTKFQVAEVHERYMVQSLTKGLNQFFNVWLVFPRMKFEMSLYLVTQTFIVPALLHLGHLLLLTFQPAPLISLAHLCLFTLAPTSDVGSLPFTSLTVPSRLCRSNGLTASLPSFREPISNITCIMSPAKSLTQSSAYISICVYSGSVGTCCLGGSAQNQ